MRHNVAMQAPWITPQPSDAPPLVLRGISSMATRQCLAELAQLYQACSGRRLEMESVGGVDAARRVQAAEVFDVVVLAADAIDKLLASGHVVPGSRVDLVRSQVVVAVHQDAPLPDISSEAALRQAVLSARRVAYSTGPSGVALAQLFERWGIAAQMRDRIVTPPPGVPVGTLLAQGRVDLGFQQRSELQGVPGIAVVGPLPPPVHIVTAFAGAVGAHSTQIQAARELLAFLASPAATPAKHKQGLEAA